MSGHNGLSVRRSARHEVALTGRVRITAEHRSVVRFAPSSGARDGWIEVDVVDVGTGGVGLFSPIFLPRHADADLEIFGKGGAEDGVLLACRSRVQRVVMTDRRPAYLVGLAFVGHSPETVKKISDLLAVFDGEDPGDSQQGDAAVA